MISGHQLDIATQRPSDNFNQRPDGTNITLVVIHNISLPPGEFNNNYIEDFFTNQLQTDQHPYFETLKEVKVSAHLLIKRDGRIIQFVDFDQRAWHAGRSSFNQIDDCNNYSIGIELEGTDNSPYETLQYQSLNQVLSILKAHYPITDIRGHSEIAPGRKTDPGPAFEWSKLS
ncbi:1,6-anhydro-N-acetylmuramyl-L-alanine amidase AmpD [Candidatus Thioglobus autotrophicus]|uniref:1,6-anhydro-N-acetylmuramyl-L-alanine amidase AmpD n=1 Tax=Candidatus Thioglobus autotrophicus TaxID=1705394 RepID=UPI00299E8771|nr:1,6-anhydro-N-acetylmuramyl-L-alanine amidase AmpD [Candidatus Thioglobus autotrophicus]WPE17969.1 1,6-anhydro-N-acetylmuramyl-L-alanine amidase AmpD [Candidatus Thioglobus autotrophicus]